MKNATLILFTGLLFFSACKKSTTSPSDVRYEFTSDSATQYKVDYSTSNSSIQSETFNGTTWSKTITMTTKSGPDNFTVARFTVFPPVGWVNTSSSANVVLKIFVNNEEKINTNAVINSANATTGVDAIVTF